MTSEVKTEESPDQEIQHDLRLGRMLAKWVQNEAELGYGVLVGAQAYVEVRDSGGVISRHFHEEFLVQERSAEEAARLLVRRLRPSDWIIGRRPQTHRLVWRIKPEIAAHCDYGVLWKGYARCCWVPNNVEILNGAEHQAVKERNAA